MVREAIVLAFLVGITLSGPICADEPKAWELPQSGYPVLTPSMQPGIGNLSRKLEYTIFSSFAVVGADGISARWLYMNNDYLLDLKAVGIVVNVSSEAEMEALRTYTDIPLIAMSGESLKEHFGEVYPFVIDSTVGGVRQ